MVNPKIDTSLDFYYPPSTDGFQTHSSTEYIQQEEESET